MSTKEKIRIAHEEEQASESDHVFRDLMQKGMSSFENDRFDEAEALFNQAANRRPVNVYPPVLIDDVKLAKMNFVEEEPELPVEKLEEYTSIEPELTAEQRVEAMYQQELQKVGLGLPPKPKEDVTSRPDEEKEVNRDGEGIRIHDEEEPVKKEEAPVEEVKTRTKQIDSQQAREVMEDRFNPTPEKSVEDVRAGLANTYPVGLTEESFMEGTRTITKRVVVKGGSGDEYRRVRHAWGGVFYFKNGTSITERVWKEETE